VDAFYEQLDDDRYRATHHTAGPWDARAQHGGPPTALLAHALEHGTPVRPELRLARVTVELMRPAPVADLTTTARVLRSGRRTELLEAELLAEGVPVLRMTASRVAASDGAVPAVPGNSKPPPLPPPGDQIRWPGAHLDGYLSATEWRPASGSPAEPGPAVVWIRPRIPLVAGHAMSAAERALLVADSGSGVSGALDVREWTYLNSDITVLLHRHPVGEWVCLDSATVIDGDGIGCSHTRLSDETGGLGHALATLVVAPRTG
jgi:hypothetical protein